jgi:predicted phosphodiesterase
MKIHIISDLHLEFAKYQPHSVSSGADVIVLPGDIGKGVQGVNWARDQ